MWSGRVTKSTKPSCRACSGSADPISQDPGVGDPEPGAAVGDSSQLAASDSAGQGPGAPGAGADSTTQDSVEVAQPEPDPPEPQPGRLVLSGVPDEAVVLLDGDVQQGTNIRLMPGTYRLVVRHPDYENFVVSPLRITDGRRRDVTVVMTLISQCDELNDSYNADGGCFDVQPRPLQATLVPLTSDIVGTPSQAMLGIKVNADGSVAQVVLITPSDNTAFNQAALRFANSIPYNPAQKDGQPITAWTKQLFFPGPRQ